jgi:hypothetical protein
VLGRGAGVVAGGRAVVLAGGRGAGAVVRCGGDGAGGVVDRREASGVIADGEAAARLDDDVGLATGVEVVVVDGELPHPASKPMTQASAPVTAGSKRRRCRPDDVMATPPTDCASLTTQRQIFNTCRARRWREKNSGSVRPTLAGGS